MMTASFSMHNVTSVDIKQTVTMASGPTAIWRTISVVDDRGETFEITLFAHSDEGQLSVGSVGHEKPVVRTFKHADGGFSDGTGFVQFINGHCYLVSRKGSHFALGYTLSDAEGYVRDGSWEELR